MYVFTRIVFTPQTATAPGADWEGFPLEEQNLDLESMPYDPAPGIDDLVIPFPGQDRLADIRSTPGMEPAADWLTEPYIGGIPLDGERSIDDLVMFGEIGIKLPNQGTIRGTVEGAPPVDAGKQGKHVPGHNNNIPSKSQWSHGQDSVNLTQEAWQQGNLLPDGTRVWDTGKEIGLSGETGVRVHIDGKGNIHGYPVNPNRYLK